MSSSQSQHARLFEAFDRLCDASESERGEELRRLEIEEPEFAAELAVLLEIDGNTARPLTQEVREHARRAIDSYGSGAPARLAEDAMPQRIGRFVIERRIGAGAMGVVYSGHDPILRREVAVKVLARGWSSGAAGMRARGEAQAMARLSHPNVVHVYGIGEHEGALYIAMERIVGQTLASWQEETRGWAEVLSVYRQAGRGLAELHACGLVHRDFKPANAMLGDDRRVRVLDLGLVREIADTTGPGDTSDPGSGGRRAGSRDTHSHAVMGTPAYMAPEQILGAEVGPAADQFSFCVALFEALYGRRPFAAKTLPQLVAAITEGRIEPKSGRGEPRRIYRALCRGLSREPERRHASMEALLDALAGRSSRRLVFGAAAAVALAAAFVPIELPDSAAECSLAERFERAWTTGRKTSVAESLPQGHAAVEATNAYAEQLANRVGQACAHEDAPSVACAAQLVERFDQVVQFLLTRPEGLSATDLVRSLPATSSCDGAERLLDIDIQEVAEIAGEMQRSQVLGFTSDLDGALEVAQKALERAQELGVASTIQEALHQRGSIHARRKELDEAGEDFSSAYELAVTRRDQGAITTLALAHVWVAKERAAFPEAEHWLRVAASANDALDPPDPSARATLLLRQGEVATSRGDMAFAREVLREAAEAWSVLDSPRNESTALSLLGWAEMSGGDRAKAIEHAERAVAVLETASDATDPTLAALHQNLGNLYQQDGDAEGAARAYTEVIRLREHSHGGDHVSTAMGRYALSTALLDLGRLEEAETLLLAALEHTPTGHPLAAACELALSQIASDRGEHDEALERGNRALVAIDERYGAEHPRAAETRTNLARHKLRAGDPVGALADARAAAPVLEAHFGPQHAALGTCLEHEAEALRRLDRPAEARPLLVRALEIAVQSHGASSEQAERIRSGLASLDEGEASND